MNNTSFEIGNNFQHHNGYIWTITSITGKTVSLESKNKTDNQIIKASMKATELRAIINAGYYTQIN